MDTSETLIRKIRAKYPKETKSDYGLAKMLHMSPQGIHSFKTRKSVFDDKAGLRIAELLGSDPAYVLACLAAERTKEANAKSTYERIAKVFQYAARTAAAVLLGVVVLQAVYFESFQMTYVVYYVKSFVLLIFLIPVISYRVNFKHLLS